MQGFIGNIEKLTEENNDFRRVLYTSKHEQLVMMSLLPGEDIGEETHELDQFLRIEHGSGVTVLDGVRHEIKAGSAIIVPAGVLHNIINTSKTMAMKLYTVYGPPAHKDGTIRKTKADVAVNEEHFDGKTTE